MIAPFFHIFSFSPHPFCTILFWPWSLVAQEFPFKSYPHTKGKKRGKRRGKDMKNSQPGCQRFHPEDESSETSTYEPCTTRTFGQGIRWAAWQAGFMMWILCFQRPVGIDASSGRIAWERGLPLEDLTQDLQIFRLKLHDRQARRRCSGAAVQLSDDFLEKKKRRKHRFGG